MRFDCERHRKARKPLGQIIHRRRVDAGDYHHSAEDTLSSQSVGGGNDLTCNASHRNYQEVIAFADKLSASKLEASIETRHNRFVVLADAVIDGAGHIPCR